MTERVKLLEAVAEAVTAMQFDGHYITPEVCDALAALDVLPAQPQGETVSKVVQISAMPASDGNGPCVFALRDDGSIWGKRVDEANAKWWREDDIPAIITLEVTP